MTNLVLSAPVQQQRSLLKSFIGNFTTDNFFSEIVAVSLYPSDFGNGKTDSIVDYIRSFLKDITAITQKHNFSNQQQVRKQAAMVASILTIRESGAVVNYNNVFNYVSVPDLAAKKIINLAIQNKIETMDSFKENLNNVVNIINCYNEIKSISSNLLLYDYLTDSVEQSSNSVFESIKSYRDLVISSYNDLSKLQILNKLDKSSDYHVLKNKETTKQLSKILSNYIATAFNSYKTGYELIDRCVYGLESSSVHIISAPSNHGKSIFLINLMRNVILNNIEDFQEDSCIIFVTLEDNIAKLSKRIASIFGNYNNNVIGDMYRESSAKIHQLQKSGSDITGIQNNIIKIFDGILIKAIDETTKFKTSIVLKYSSDNTFSAADLSKFIEQLRVTENLNTKLILVDYIDVMRASISGTTESEYTIQGKIVHELRQLSVNLNLPILTATQNTRESENSTAELSNRLIGDSYLKVKARRL